jgi:hypothetical protein
MENNYYLYYHCNQWKMRDSFNLVGVFEESKLKQIIIEDVKNEDIEFSNKDVDTIVDMDVRTIDNLITYGYIEKIVFNERV